MNKIKYIFMNKIILVTLVGCLRVISLFTSKYHVMVLRADDIPFGHNDV